MDPTTQPAGAPAAEGAPVAPPPQPPVAALPALPAQPATPPPAVSTEPPKAEPPKPRVLNPYARPAAAAVPVDPRVAALESQVASQREALSGFATASLAEAPANVQATVRAIAGDDPAAQLRALAALRANNLAGPVVLPPGASTASPPTAPTPAPPADSDAAHLAAYERAKATAPAYAAAYRLQHAASIARAEQARGVTH